MAQYYLDVSAPGNEYQVYADTPVWGGLAANKPLPMDGNGLAGPGHAAAVAIAELQITVNPADTNTLVIAGAVLTAKTTTAAKNQFAIGGLISVTVMNLVALINTFGTGTAQCDAVVNVGSSAAQLALPYWQFARVKPGTTDTIQIAMRIAGLDLNFSANSNVSISSSGWATPPTLTQFAGGANGPLGYLWSTSASVFGKGLGLYGIQSQKSSGVTDPGLTADIISIRSARSGASLSLSFTTTAGVSASLVCPTATRRQYVVDHGALWTGDNGVFTLNFTSSGTASIVVRSADSTTFSWDGGALGGMLVNYTSSSTGNTLKFGGSDTTYTQTLLVNVDLIAISNTSILNIGGFSSNISNARKILRNCRLTLRYAQTLFYNDYGSAGTLLLMVACEVNYIGIAANVSGIVNVGSSGGGEARFVATKFSVDGGAWQVTNPVASGAANTAGEVTVIFDNCNGIGASSFGMIASGVSMGTNRRFVWDDTDSSGSYRVEYPSHSNEWINNGTFPTLSSLGRNGLPLSSRTFWRLGGVTAERPAQVAKYSTYYNGASGAKTLILEVFSPVAEPPTLAAFNAFFKYIDTSGVVRYESVAEAWAKYAAGTATVMPASGASWTPNGVTGYEARRLSVTTTFSVRTGSEITLDLFIAAPPVAADRYVYINPEILVV